MPIYYGSQKLGDLYIGSTKISEVYKGSIKVYSSSQYTPDQIIFESATPSTYSLDLLETGKYEVYCVAGGGSGTFRYSQRGMAAAGGGSGSGFIGIIYIEKNTYSITVAAGGSGNYEGYGYTGGNSNIGSILITYGGGGANTHNYGNIPGSGGSIPSVNTTTYSVQLNSAGNTGGAGTGAGGGASLYNGYGQGGAYLNGAGTTGYVKIVYKGK